MSKVERKEYQETKILRTVSPQRRIGSSTQDLSQFDSNLDHLLEDLQNSVSRPGSSLGQNATTTYKESTRHYNTVDSGRSNSLNRISNVKSSNPITEYSSDDAYTYSSPDRKKGEKIHEYKKEKYMYGYTTKTRDLDDRDLSPERNRIDNNITQLDSLLDDLQQVKKESSYNSSGYRPSSQNTVTKTVNREIHYGETPRSASRSQTLERLEQKRDYQYSSNEGTYGNLRSTSPSPSSRTSTLSRQKKVTNVHEYPVQVIETSAPDIDPEVLAHLDPNLHPPGNTKVTTTIKTYTYEIPGSGSYPTNFNETTNTSYDSEKYVYSPNQTITTPSKSFTYNKIENKENTTLYKNEPAWTDIKGKMSYKESVTDNVNYNYQPYQKPSPPGGVVVKETVTTRNYQPGYSPELSPPSSQQTYVYNESTTTKNVDYPPAPRAPSRQETYIINKETNVTNRTEPPYHERGYPVGNPPSEPPSKTTIVEKVTHTTNYQNGYGPHGSPQTPKDVERFPNKPPQDINIHYNYKSTNINENRYKGGYPPSKETETLLPGKFPTDSTDVGPPKKLDELMASIGQEPPNSPLNAGYIQHEKEIQQQKKIDLLKQQSDVDDSQKKEPVERTKNVSGPPVYYPPNHELFAKKEEGAWRSEGAYGKASGKYMYEAESKSKSKQSSGRTVVPVCLPLCCGLPCSLL